MVVTLNSHFNELTDLLDKTALMVQTSEASSNTRLATTSDHLTMTKEKLDSAVTASKRILQEAANGKLPRYV